MSSRAVSANIDLGCHTITNISFFRESPREYIQGRKPHKEGDDTPASPIPHNDFSPPTATGNDLVRPEHLQAQNQRPPDVPPPPWIDQGPRQPLKLWANLSTATAQPFVDINPAILHTSQPRKISFPLPQDLVLFIPRGAAHPSTNESQRRKEKPPPPPTPHLHGLLFQNWPPCSLTKTEAGCCGFFRTSRWSASFSVDGSLPTSMFFSPCALDSLVTVYSCLTMMVFWFLISEPCMTSTPSSLSSSKYADLGLIAPRTDVRTLPSLLLKADDSVWPLRPA